jgi:hypothetical protein
MAFLEPLKIDRKPGMVVAVSSWMVLCLVSCSPVSPAEPFPPAGSSPSTEVPALAPANSPVDTALPAPTDMPVPAVDPAATRTAYAGMVPAEVEEKMREIGESMEEGTVAWADPVTITVASKYQEFQYWLLEGAEFSDFIYHGRVRWDGDVRILSSSQVALYCSVLFRTTGDVGNRSGWWYEASLGWGGGTPVGTFWTVEEGAVPLKFQRKPDVVIRDGYLKDNEIILIVKGTQWDLYVNGEQVLVWWDVRLDKGGFGFGARDYLSGGSECRFSDNWIWKLA